ncbi:hypothetical protein BRARA_A02515 [Brassica rapa]|uniref:Hydroxyproline-rich glycoprotein family protein n=1 Tax=Brassica campestris TaxID=3711 RepID=A0A398AQ12_BRACM|nr:hypothetical protein BRARA_A02515 [Brassica rapa]
MLFGRKSASKLQPVNSQSSPKASKNNKQDVKPSSSPNASSPMPIRSSKSILSRRTSSNLSPIGILKNASIREAKSPKTSSSPKWTCNFILMVELRRKIITFRDIIDLPPLDGSPSITDMVMHTMKDLQNICPEIINSSLVSEIRRANVDKVLDHFLNALKSMGDSWIDNSEWIAKSKFWSSSVGKNQSDRLVQALEKLSPVDVKRLAIHIMSLKEAQESNQRNVEDEINVVEQNKQKSNDVNMEKEETAVLDEQEDTIMKVSPLDSTSELWAESLPPPPSPPLSTTKTATLDSLPSQPPPPPSPPLIANADDVSILPMPHPPPPPLHMPLQSSVPPPPHPPPVTVVAVQPPAPPPPLAPLPGTAAAPLPPPPPPMKNRAPPPPPMPTTNRVVSGPPPPPPTMAKGTAPPPAPPPMANGPAPPPPPPRMGVLSGAACPPPPPGAARSLRPKKAATKLKRSTQLGNLYRILKGKVEGRDPEARTGGGSGRKAGVGSAPAGGKQGMADALAEITKKSAYFQQIQEDVAKYMKSINELKIEITKFKTKDMTELLSFHSRVESVLEKLTDETQVLARCEGFPQKKLEAIRMAAALFSKLHGMITELQNWKIEPPLNQLLDKVERYFTKIKGDIDTLDRTKDEEAKKFQSHNIHFDFNILVQIKETMVDISSSCMELALKEKRDAKLVSPDANPSMKKTVGSAKMLWRAFQFAFKVYTFAGGHDDRADSLTRELAHEIQTDPQNP